MKRIPLSLFLVLVALVLVVGSALAFQMNFRAHMQANDIVSLPVGTESDAQGQAIFQLSEDGVSISYKLNVANIDKITMAHIHAPKTTGVNGPIIVWLYPSPSSTGPGAPTERFDGGLVSGSFSAGDLRNAFTWSDLLALMADGGAYVNVHSSDAPAGEINGHIH